MSVGGVVLRSDALASVLITILDEVLTIIVKFAEYVDYKWPYLPDKVFIVYLLFYNIVVDTKQNHWKFSDFGFSGIFDDIYWAKLFSFPFF